MTFSDMCKDPQFQKLALDAKHRNNIADDVFEAALTMLQSSSLSKKRIEMIVELQLYLNYFLEKRRMCHIW